MRRRVHADGLVSPGAVERVLGDRQQFDVRETHVSDVADEFVGKFAIAQIAIVGLAAPGAEVHFIDADGPIEWMARWCGAPSRNRRPNDRSVSYTMEALPGGGSWQ